MTNKPLNLADVVERNPLEEGLPVDIWFSTIDDPTSPTISISFVQSPTVTCYNGVYNEHSPIYLTFLHVSPREQAFNTQRTNDVLIRG